MINSEQWRKTVPGINLEKDNKDYNLDPKKWLNTLPKKNKKSFSKNFSITLVIFIVGLIFVSVIKNKTRSLQKEINDLQASIGNLKIDLHLTTLDYEVITSPENLSKLAKKHLEFELSPYKKSQIKNLNDEKNLFSKKKEIKETSQSSVVKIEIVKKIKKIKKLYSEPKKIPEEVKITVVRKFEKKKEAIKKAYHNPKDTISMEKIQRWGALQIVKAFFGIPIIPGK
tara:strand:+ start:230 stop:910 length:681 start_codon:yes stop_codon:yes gene_type:complete